MCCAKTVCDILELSYDTNRINRSSDKDTVSREDLILESQIIVLDDALDLSIRCLTAGSAAAALSDIKRNSVYEFYFYVFPAAFAAASTPLRACLQ